MADQDIIARVRETIPVDPAGDTPAQADIRTVLRMAVHGRALKEGIKALFVMSEL
jgi:hypothetical protein